VELTVLSADAGVLAALVAFEPGEPLRTCEIPGLAAAAIAALPGLRGHRCDNGAGLTFADELADTEVAHLVEHAALELMAMAGCPATLRGETSWDFASDGRGVFRVRIAYTDEPVARAAAVSACALVGSLARGDVAPDAEAEARRLRGLGARRPSPTSS
jgi:hypothetical protein